MHSVLLSDLWSVSAACRFSRRHCLFTVGSVLLWPLNGLLPALCVPVRQSFCESVLAWSSCCLLLRYPVVDNADQVMYFTAFPRVLLYLCGTSCRSWIEVWLQILIYFPFGGRNAFEKILEGTLTGHCCLEASPNVRNHHFRFLAKLFLSYVLVIPFHETVI